jgi:aldehyde:ferredoxin oxidoreductase
MECFEKGLLTLEDTGGIALRFGNDEALLECLRLIGERRGLGDLLADVPQPTKPTSLHALTVSRPT